MRASTRSWCPWVAGSCNAVRRAANGRLVGEAVMKSKMTAILRAAQARGCRFQVGTDMLFEMIPACLEFCGFPSTTQEQLRESAKLQY